MDLQILSNLREAVRVAIKTQYPTKNIYTAEITSVVDQQTDTVLDEFFTVFFSEGEETQENQALDDVKYRTDTQITVGYFNKQGAINQSFLESEAKLIRNAVMALNETPVYEGGITRDGWQYVPAGDGGISGIYCRFGFSFSN